MRILLIMSFLLLPFALAGCETWAGIKKDTQKGWDATKGAVHDATH